MELLPPHIGYWVLSIVVFLVWTVIVVAETQEYTLLDLIVGVIVSFLPVLNMFMALAIGVYILIVICGNITIFKA